MVLLLGVPLPWLIEVGIGVEIEGDKKGKGRGFRWHRYHISHSLVFFVSVKYFDCTACRLLVGELNIAPYVVLFIKNIIKDSSHCILDLGCS